MIQRNTAVMSKVSKGDIKTKVSKVPRIDEPFQRIAMDMVGTLPRTKRGNQSVLVISDYATRYIRKRYRYVVRKQML